MKRTILPVAALAAILLISFRIPSAKGTGQSTTQTPEVSAFDAVELSYPVHATIHIVPGAKPAVTLKGDDDVLQHIKTKVRNNMLTISSDNHFHMNYDDGPVTADITLPAMTELSVAGSAHAETVGKLKGARLQLEVTGSGRVEIPDADVSNIKGEVAGSGRIIISGSATRGEYSVTGSGRIEGFGLRLREAGVNVTGSGKGEVNVTDKLSASIHGSGTIYYKGDPGIADKEVVGSGLLKHVD